MTSQATKMVREMGADSEPLKSAGIADPTEDEIATVAYYLWLDEGAPIGSDQEHWFRAEAILRNGPAQRQDLARRRSIPRTDSCTGSDVVAEFIWERWEGHWEVWEREWGCANWVWDLRNSGVRVSKAAK